MEEFLFMPKNPNVGVNNAIGGQINANVGVIGRQIWGCLQVRWRQQGQIWG